MRAVDGTGFESGIALVWERQSLLLVCPAASKVSSPEPGVVLVEQCPGRN